jgi:hypothetical protein
VGQNTPWKPARPAKVDDTHECPAPWCARRVAPTMFACRQDWYSLPQHLRDAIWAGYRDQSDGGAAHRLAMATAIQFYRDNPR